MREQAEQVGARERGMQHRAHGVRAYAIATAVVPSPATTQISGQRSQTIVTKVKTAKAAASGGPRRLLPSVAISLIAVAMMRPGGDRAHAAQRARDGREARELGVRGRQHQDDDERHGEHAGDRGERALEAEEAVAEHQPEVDDVRPGQDLAEREHLDEFVAREPALSLDELALRDREDAAETLQREAIEGEEEVARRGRPGPRDRALGVASLDLAGRRRHAALRCARLAQALRAIAAASQATPTRLSGA